MWRQIYYGSPVRLWLNSAKRTSKKLPNLRYYRNKDKMEKDKFCWLEWNFAKGPLQTVAWISSLVPRTPPLLFSLTLMFARLFLSSFSFAPLLFGVLPFLKYVFTEMPPALLVLTVSFVDLLQQWNHGRAGWKCLCPAWGCPLSRLTDATLQLSCF